MDSAKGFYVWVSSHVLFCIENDCANEDDSFTSTYVKMHGEHTGAFALAPFVRYEARNERHSKSSIECITEWGHGHTRSHVIAQQLVFQNG